MIQYNQTTLTGKVDMKKVAIFLILIFVLCGFCACGPKKNSGSSDDNSQGDVSKMYVTIYGNKLEVTLENNSSVKALVELLKQGDITYTADDYGGFEKVGSIGHSLPTNNSQITTEAGDVILYQGSQICIMVGSNSWSYTRIGKINGYSVSKLKDLVGTGKGSAEVTLSLV